MAVFFCFKINQISYLQNGVSGPEKTIISLCLFLCKYHSNAIFIFYFSKTKHKSFDVFPLFVCMKDGVSSFVIFVSHDIVSYFLYIIIKKQK